MTGPAPGDGQPARATTGRCDPDRSGLERLVAWVSLTAVFLAYSAVHAPVPGAGEPHYLAKARHFHDPAWCANDFFLQSANAHPVFYATVGSLTRWLSFDAAAWAGRALACALVAWGWLALFGRLCHHAAGAIAVAGLVLASNAVGSLSGEWLFNGVEGKVFGYGLLFLAGAKLLDGRLVAAGCAAGLAVAFHPVVGAWGVLTGLVGAALVSARAGRNERPGDEASNDQQPRSASVRAALLSLVAFVALSLPGVLPALGAMGGRDTFEADRIQVFYRLGHHLVPSRLSGTAVAAYVAMIVVWVATRRVGHVAGDSDDAEAERWWSATVAASILVAVAGLAIGWGPRPEAETLWSSLRLKGMKLYPFRLADTLVPIAAAVALVRWVAASRRVGRRVAVALCAAVFAFALGWGHRTRWQPPLPPAMRGPWESIGRWTAAHTPADAVVLTRPDSWGFRWRGERAEYVTFKDCPQDAAGILEWQRRLDVVNAWLREERRGTGVSRASLRRLGDATGVTHVLLFRGEPAPFEIRPIRENAHFALYRIADAESSP